MSFLSRDTMWLDIRTAQVATTTVMVMVMVRTAESATPFDCEIVATQPHGISSSIVFVGEVDKSVTIPMAPVDTAVDKDDNQNVLKSESVSKMSLAKSISHSSSSISENSKFVEVKDALPERNFSPTTICALLALGVHALFESLVVGLGQTPSDVLVPALCIAAHKWAENVALACQFMEQRIKFKVSVTYLVIFNFITIFGITVGAIAGHSSTAVEGAFQALAAGTILYVAVGLIFEVFGSPPHREGFLGGKFVLFLSFCFGALVILAVSIAGQYGDPVTFNCN